MEVTIEKLGSEGLGVALFEGASILVADALPGEIVRVLPSKPPQQARLLERLSQSPDRVTPPCRHFSVCGGCSLQHLAPSAYERFKRDLIANALRREGLAPIDIAPTLISPPHSRRRATFAIKRTHTGVIMGFHGKASHQIAPIDACPVLRPELEALLPSLRQLFGLLLSPGKTGQVILTAVDTGVDLGLTLPEIPQLAGLETLAAFADTHNLARLWWQSADLPPQPVAERRAAIIDVGRVDAFTAMCGFIQATRQGQQALIDAVIKGLGTASKVLDLYAGIGTFSLPIASQGVAVHAVEGDVPALSVLGASARRANLNITTERRDLEQRPLIPDEIARFDAIVFDPPRAGAKSQVAMIARTEVPIVIAVSCNPATFARDASILVEAGWLMTGLQPVDQFLWSRHIELVARFDRSPASLPLDG